MNREIRKIDVYAGTYMDIQYEIRNWEMGDGKPGWAFYIFLREAQIPERFAEVWLKGKKMEFSKHIMYNYNNTFIDNLDWHMGCTFYEKVAGFDKSPRVVKIGCDYQHLYDEGKIYQIDYVMREAEMCIESLHSMVKVLKWCRYCGEYVETLDERGYCQNCPPERK